MKNKCKIFIYSFLTFLFISCASKPGFNGEGDLCGLVIDENNRPVADFVVYSSNKDNPNQKTSALTNSSGLFVFQNTKAGTYYISGEKKNYTRLEKTEYQFYQRSNIICFQVTSFKGTIQSVDELLLRKESVIAENLLNSIVCEEKSEAEALVNSYLFFLSQDSNLKSKILEKLKKVNGPHFNYFSEYSALLKEGAK